MNRDDIPRKVSQNSENSPYSTASFMVANIATQYGMGSMAISFMFMSSSICTSTVSDCSHGHQAPWVVGTSNATILLGAITGQLGMGKLGDASGRNTAFLATMSVATLGSVMSAIIPHGSATLVYLAIILCRFLVGVGLGGVYPLSATKASEDGGSADGNKVDSITAAKAFFWQMPGIMSPYVVAYFIVADNQLTVDASWRLLLGFGSVPAGIATILLILERLYLKKKRPPALNASNIQAEAQRTAVDPPFKGVLAGHHVVNTESPGTSPPSSDDDVARNSKLSTSARSLTSISTLTATDVPELPDTHQARLDSRRSMTEDIQIEYAQDPLLTNRFLVAGFTWFLFDIIVYGVGLFGPEIIYAISDTSDNISSPSSIKNITGKMLLVQFMAIPATCLGIFIMQKDYMTLKMMQIVGFSLIALACCIFAMSYPFLRKTSPSGLYSLFCVVGFFMQFLVNITTFVMPAAVFRKEVRASFNGLSAAMGKCGAVVGAFLFPAIGTGTPGVIVIMSICTLAGFTGAAITAAYLKSSMLNDGEDSGKPMEGFPELPKLPLESKKDVDRADEVELGSSIVSRGSMGGSGAQTQFSPAPVSPASTFVRESIHNPISLN